MEYIFTNPQDISAEHYKRMFGIKEICKEMGSPCIYVSDEDKWVLAIEADTLVAFGGVKYKKGGMWIEHLYTYPQFRGQGICRRIIELCLSLPHKVAYASVVAASKRIFESVGFERVTGGGI